MRLAPCAPSPRTRIRKVARPNGDVAAATAPRSSGVAIVTSARREDRVTKVLRHCVRFWARRGGPPSSLGRWRLPCCTHRVDTTLHRASLVQNIGATWQHREHAIALAAGPNRRPIRTFACSAAGMLAPPAALDRRRRVEGLDAATAQGGGGGRSRRVCLVPSTIAPDRLAGTPEPHPRHRCGLPLTLRAGGQRFWTSCSAQRAVRKVGCDAGAQCQFIDPDAVATAWGRQLRGGCDRRF